MAFAIAAVTLTAVPPLASAAVEWKGPFYSAPTNMVPGERAGIQVLPGNAGSTLASGMPTVKFELPTGVTLAESDPFYPCTGTSTVVCTSFEIPVPAASYVLAGANIVVDVAPSAPVGTFDVPVTFEGGGAAAPVTQIGQITIGSAPNSFGTIPNSFLATALDDGGVDYTQAGGHPFVATTSFSFKTKFVDPAGTPGLESAFIEMVEPVEPLRDVVVDAPAGFVGNATAIPKCSDVGALLTDSCPPDSQVGVAVIDQKAVPQNRMTAIYNMEPDGDLPAKIAFTSPAGPVVLRPILRSDGDWGLSVQARNISEGNPLFSTSVTLWGIPAQSIHDPQRCSRPNELTRTCAGVDSFGAPGNGSVPQDAYEPHSSTAPVLPFISLPTECSGEDEVTRLHVANWTAAAPYTPDGNPFLGQGGWISTTATAPPLTNCDALEFNPTLKARPTTNAADSPTGLEVDLGVPQNEDPDGLATAHLKDTTVTLPEGLVINPSGANGLEGCSVSEVGLTSPVGNDDPVFDKADPNCPDAAKVGTVEVDTPLLEDPLHGSVYVAEPFKNPFNSLLSIYITVKGPGLIVKIAGEVSPDPQTGRLTTVVKDNPQVPFEHFKLNFFGGAAASLKTPATCGTYSTTSELTPWSAPHTGPSATPKDTYAISQGANGGACAQPHNPTMEAGSTAPLAGAFSPFVLNLRREDGSQQFSSVTLTPPQGLVAKLAGTPACSDAALAAAAAKTGKQEQASPSCPPASAVGNVIAGAGAGPAPYYAPGKAYLSGPYKGAPLSLAIITPAVAGPFDLGTIVVRTALYLDSKTAQITAVSDPIPTILKGIPLDVRSISVRMDKPQFTLNPTTCDPSAVTGSLISTTGAAAALNNRFQLAECGQLGFKPQLKLSLKGGTKRSKYPALTATLTPRPGDANIASVAVAFPPSEFLAQEHIRTVCTRVQFAADQCPAASVYGTATVTTPLLDYPLTGPVYLRSSSNPLPDLVPDLRGPAFQPIKLEAAGRTDSVNKGIRNTFDFVPDAPFTKLVLQMQGGKKGLLVNSTNICAEPYRAKVSYGAHNGASFSAKPLLRAQCGKARKGKKSKGKSGAKGNGKR